MQQRLERTTLGFRNKDCKTKISELRIQIKLMFHALDQVTVNSIFFKQASNDIDRSELELFSTTNL